MPPRFTVTPAHPRKLTNSQWKILLIIASSKGEPVSRNEIARLASCCFRTVKRAMQMLVACGYVEVVYRFNGDGGQLANSYRITPKARQTLDTYAEVFGGEQALLNRLLET